MVVRPKIAEFVADPLAFLDDLIIPSAHGSRRFGDCMADFQRERFRMLAPALLAVMRNEQPSIGRHFWEATKSASKDSDLAACLLWQLAFTQRPIDIQIGAADADQADELRKAARDILYLNPWLSARVSIQNRKIVCGKTGNAAEIIPADLAGSQGSRPSVLVLNELSQITKQEFAENMMDNSSKMPRGLVVVATNAGFTGSWQFEWRELARLSDRWSFHQWAQPAPWLDPAEIEEAKRRNSQGRFLRLFYGQWVSASGDALDPADVQAAVTLAHADNDRHPDFDYAAGLDIGWKHDHSSFSIFGRHRKSQRLRLVRLVNWAPKAGGEVDLQDVEVVVDRLCRQFGATVAVDPHQAALLMQRLRSRGVRVEEVPFTGANLNTMAGVVLEAFRSRQVDLYPDDLLLADFSRLVLTEKSYGHRLEAVRDKTGHADRATAAILAMLQARSAKRKRIILVG